MHFSSSALLPASLLTLSFASSSWAQAPTPIPVPSASFTGCPIDGPVLPRPTDLSQSRHVKAAAANLTAQLDAAVAGEIQAGWNVENVSFSLSFASPFDGEDGEPFWEYHHLGEANVRGTMEVDGDSQYLIGSVTKVFSDLLLLKSGLNLNDPITKFLPDLKKGRSNIEWEDITLAMMSEHLAGIPPNCM
jgi:CubicO group peptidase (beta-lactamase class C family)